MVMTATVLLGLIVAAVDFRRDTLQTERALLGRWSVIFDERDQRLLRAVQQSMESFAQRIQAEAPLPGQIDDRLEQKAADALLGPDGLPMWALVRPDGQVLAPAYMTGETDFGPIVQRAAAAGSQGANWGEPVLVGIDRFWALPVVRLLPAQSGAVGSALIGLLPVSSLLASFSGVATTPGIRVAVLRGDELLAEIGVPETAGPFVKSVRPLGRTGLRLLVEHTRASTFALWRRQVGSLAMLGAAVIAVTLLLLTRLARQAGSQAWIRRALSLRNAMLERAQANLVIQTGQLEATTAALRGKERQLAERSQTLDTTLQHIDQGVMMVDPDGFVVVYNRHVVDMLDIPDALLSTRPQFGAILQHQFEKDEFAKTGLTLVEFIQAGGIVNAPRVYTRERPNGRWLEILSMPLPGGGVVRTFADITDRRRAEAQIDRAAHVDELTGLPNRVSLRKEMDRRLSGDADDLRIGVLYLNIDRFRLLNDARGHDVGDRVLVEIARRLQASARPGDVVARTGGDEFALLHSPERSEDELMALGEDLLGALSQPIHVGDARITVTVSIGVAVATAGMSTDGILRSADVAMYRAKDRARNTLSRYDPAMTTAQQERFHLEQSLREAIGTDALRLAYQPIFSTETGSVCGYEALLRWTDRVRGNVPPSAFIPVAETTGLIVPLGRMVLEWACFEAASWPNTNTIAVNLSPAQFEDTLLIDTIRDVLERSGLAPDRLELEVTESMLLDNTDTVHETALELCKLGLSLTLDDFGTGHAGLSTLRRFPFRKIKIDRSFVSTLGSAPESDAIVEAVLLLGRRLGLRVVAEGVEETSQLEHLQRMRCPLVQGYLMGRPRFFDQAITA